MCSLFHLLKKKLKHTPFRKEQDLFLNAGLDKGAKNVIMNISLIWI